jgi:hypothetical protein
MPTRDDALDAQIDAIQESRARTLTASEAAGRAADEWASRDESWSNARQAVARAKARIAAERQR